MIALPPWEPDRSIFNTMSTDTALNVIPVSANEQGIGWGAMPSAVVQSSALAAEPRGAVFFRKSDGTTGVVAGTATNLYLLNTGASPYSWTSIGSGYSLGADDRWDFTLYGNQLIASTIEEYPQYYDIELGGSFANRTTEFKAKYCQAVGDYLVFAYLENKKNTVRWSSLNDASAYDNGRRGSDEKLIAQGQEITGIVPLGKNAIIMQRDRMEGMFRQAVSRSPFSFSAANTARGAIAPFSLVKIGPERFVYYSEDGFFADVPGQPIGAERVNRWFAETLDNTYINQMIGFNDPINDIAWWRYRNTSADNRLIGYDWRLDRWCYSDADLLEAASLATPGVSWDGLANLYGSIDEVDVPFSSPLWNGGKPIFAGFNSSYELVYMAGSNMAAQIDTAWVQLTPGRRTFVQGARLGGDPLNYTIKVGEKESEGETGAYGNAISPSSRGRWCHMRNNAWNHRFRVDIPAGENWDTVSSIKDILATPDGEL